MAKKKTVKPKSKETDKASLGDLLQSDVVKKLREKKADLKKAEEQKEEVARKKAIEERKRKEANKSFEELLADSNLDWRSFKDE